jgi:hypothetical protein
MVTEIGGRSINSLSGARLRPTPESAPPGPSTSRLPGLAQAVILPTRVCSSWQVEIQRFQCCTPEAYHSAEKRRRGEIRSAEVAQPALLIWIMRPLALRGTAHGLGPSFACVQLVLG